MGRYLTTELREKLFTVIRSGLDIDNPPIQLADEDYDELLQIAKQQSIKPIVHRGLKTQGAPAEIVRTFDRERLKDTRQYIIQYDSLNKISAALNEAQIQFIPLGRDSEASIIYHLYTDEPENLPENRKQYGFDNRGFRFGSNKEITETMNCGEYRVFSDIIPLEYHVSAIMVGMKKRSEVLWKYFFRPNRF